MKAIVTLLFIYCCFNAVFAQNETVVTTASAPKKNKCDIVIKPAVGLNVTDFSKDIDGGEFKGKVGWQTGVSATFNKKKMYIEPGIFYAQKKVKFEGDTSSDDTKVDYSGIHIPLAVGRHLMGDEKSFFSVHAFAGGSVFFITDANYVDKDLFRSPSWGLFAGAGINVYKLFLDLKYEWAITDALEDAADTNAGKPMTFFANVGIRLPL